MKHHGPKLQRFLKVKDDLSEVLIFQYVTLQRLSLQLWTFSKIFIFFLNHFVKVELSYVFTINLFTIAENCTEKWIIL